MENQIAGRIGFYANIQKLAKKAGLITGMDLAEIAYRRYRESPQDSIAMNLDSSCLQAAYGMLSYYHSTVICFKIWAKFNHTESLFIIEVAPHYGEIFCKDFLPTLKDNCQAVNIVVFTKPRERQIELYSSF
jgi:hypothetical protein